MNKDVVLEREIASPVLPEKPVFGRISGEFADSELEHDFRSTYVDTTARRAKLFFWIILLTTALIILVIWQRFGLTNEFYELAGVRFAVAFLALGCMVLVYRSRNWQFIDNASAVLLIALLLLTWFYGSYAAPTNVSLVARNLISVSLAYMIKPTRMNFIIVYAVGMTAILIYQLLFVLTLYSQEITATITCAVLINLAGYYMTRANAMSRRETWLLRKQAEVLAVTAQRANQSKSEYMAALNHELRTPMTAVIGFGQVLKTTFDESATDKQRECVEFIISGGEHMVEIANQVLDLARMETGQIDLSPSEVDIGDLIFRCAGMIAPDASQNGLQVHQDIAEPSPVAWADATRTRQVLLNLLSNAVKYNRKNGDIRISARQGSDAVLVSVSDSGNGIPADRMEDLFEPFNRLDQAESGIDGSGIGLPIARNIVLAMNGRMGVDSVVGEGSTFWFELPLSSAANGPQA
jgi:signal transduction histidine kinase